MVTAMVPIPFKRASAHAQPSERRYHAGPSVADRLAAAAALPSETLFDEFRRAYRTSLVADGGHDELTLSDQSERDVDEAA